MTIVHPPAPSSHQLTLTRGRSDYADLAWEVIVPPRASEVWAWCRQHLRMHDGSKWSERRALLMRHWYRVIATRLAGRQDPADPYAHLVEQVYLCLCTQIAKTTLQHDMQLYAMGNYPRKSAYYVSRGKDLEDHRKYRLQPRLEGIPVLERKLPDGPEARERALSNRTWTVGTHQLYWLNANIIDDLRSGDYPFIGMDEMERYGTDIDELGDPVDQGLSRQRTHPKTRLLVGTSSPGQVHGHMWRQLCAGSHERPLVQCPSCGGVDWLNPRQLVHADPNIKLIETPAKAILREHLARWVCRHNGCIHNAEAVQRMVLDCAVNDRWVQGTWSMTPEHPLGHWAPDAEIDSNGRLVDVPPIDGTIRSGQANSLYSIDVTIDTFAAAMSNAEAGTPAKRKTFANNERAEPAFLAITQADVGDIKRTTAAETPYTFGSLPWACTGLLLHFDQQGNKNRESWWFPWTLRAFTWGGASWLVAAGTAANAAERDELERKTWRIGGVDRVASVTSMDSANGHFLFDAYLWAAAKKQTRILLKGDSRIGDGTTFQEVIDGKDVRRKTQKPPGVREYRIHPHWWRTELWDRMCGKPAAGGILRPRWCLPTDAPDFYLASLTSEEQVGELRRTRGPGSVGGYETVYVWRPRMVHQLTGSEETVRKDNHWWDGEVSILALSHILGLHVRPAAPKPPAPARPVAGPSMQERRRVSRMGYRR